MPTDSPVKPLDAPYQSSDASCKLPLCSFDTSSIPLWCFFICLWCSVRSVADPGCKNDGSWYSYWDPLRYLAQWWPLHVRQACTIITFALRCHFLGPPLALMIPRFPHDTPWCSFDSFLILFFAFWYPYDAALIPFYSLWCPLWCPLDATLMPTENTSIPLWCLPQFPLDALLMSFRWPVDTLLSLLRFSLDSSLILPRCPLNIPCDRASFSLDECNGEITATNPSNMKHPKNS